MKELYGVLAYIGESKQNFDRCEEYLEKFYLPLEATQIITDIKEYYSSLEEGVPIEWESFRTWFHIERHPSITLKKHKLYDSIIDNILASPPEGSALRKVYELQVADTIRAALDDVDEGGSEEAFESVVNLIETYQGDRLITCKDYMVDLDIEGLVETVIKGDGIEWRIPQLNQSVGQVHEGDLILVAKRPETGGTTFLTSEFTHMLNQLPEGKSAIIFNNEEGGAKIGLRVVQSALGITSMDIMKDVVKVQADFDKFLGTKKVYICDPPGGLTVKFINEVLTEHPECWLIGLNVLDKIGGFYKMDEVARQRKIAEWARNVAKKHGAVIAIVQADVSAEGQQYMDQSQVYGSKTGVQGEADVMIMIGRDHSNDGQRYFSVAKNKKPTTGVMEPEKRHLRFVCNFDQDRGRFK